ncbi:hypothetical protein PR048_021649 [Dryococelus australis]|uniref:Uncharacterized protein n=1 Tax=Dryococelus australis TaxID=614101 RepID=A0ABQ9GYU8_9NEOP|nr:hypothetical protein PR048_021649 [Dryococelus australis]
MDIGNLVCNNGYCCSKRSCSSWSNKDCDNITRRDFLVSLGRDLIKEHLASRSAMKNLPNELCATISRIVDTEEIISCLFLRNLQEDVNATSAPRPRITSILPTVPSVAEEFANPIVLFLRL